MIKAAVFDIDNTLYDYDGAHAVAYKALTAFAAEALGLPPADFQALERTARSTLEARTGNAAVTHNRLIRYQLILESLHRSLAWAPAMDSLYWTTLLSVMRPYPELEAVLTRLKAMGIVVGIGTNMTADRQYAKLQRLGILPLVDFMVTSEEACVEKPERGLFELCAAKAGCPAAQCAFIGDNPVLDVRGALSAGMRAVWLRRECESAEAVDGALVIRTLSELPRLISAQNEIDFPTVTPCDKPRQHESAGP